MMMSKILAQTSVDCVGDYKGRTIRYLRGVEEGGGVGQ